jgi:hypothetical protein
VSRLSLWLLLALAATGVVAEQPKPQIRNLAATAAGGKVSIRFDLEGAFTSPEMVEALQSGLPTSFTYHLEIFRDHPNWFDDSIAKSRIEVICTFNALTREYLLNYRRDRHLVRSQTFSDLRELERNMTRIVEADFFDVGEWKPHKLKVRAKADLMRGWLMYVIPWEVSSPWRETRVRTTRP